MHKPISRLAGFLIPVTLFATGIAGFIYMRETRPQQSPQPIEEQRWRVSVQPVELQTRVPTLTLYARIESPRNTTLRAPSFSLSAVTEVLAVDVLEGEQVTKGQLLIRLDDRDSRLNLQQRSADAADIKAQITLEKQTHTSNQIAIKYEEALLALAGNGVERAQQLERQRVGSQSSLDSAQQSLEQQRISLNTRRTSLRTHDTRLQQLQARLQRTEALRDAAALEVERTRITAPFDGLIALMSVSQGDRVRSGDALLSLYDNTILEARAQIPERFHDLILTALQNGQALKATVANAHPSLRLQLNRLSGQITAGSGGVDGIFRVLAGMERLRIGQFLHLTVQLPPQDNLALLPFNAIYGTNRIYRLTDERMQGIPIQVVGEQQTGDGKILALIRSETLQSGDRVITTQLPNAMDGLRVEVTE